jgi:hypothetical protein
MALSEREKAELAEVIAAIVYPAIEDLKKDVVSGMVETINQVLEGLAQILEERNAEQSQALHRMIEKRDKPAWLDRVLG